MAHGCLGVDVRLVTYWNHVSVGISSIPSICTFILRFLILVVQKNIQTEALLLCI